VELPAMAALVPAGWPLACTEACIPLDIGQVGVRAGLRLLASFTQFAMLVKPAPGGAGIVRHWMAID